MKGLAEFQPMRAACRDSGSTQLYAEIYSHQLHIRNKKFQAKIPENRLGHLEMQDLGLPRRLVELQARDGDRQAEALCTGAAGVNVQDAVMPVGFGLVSVAADDDVEAGGFRVEVELFKIVQDVDRDILEFDDCRERKGRGPGLGVHVPANGEDGRDGFELVEDGRAADVTCVNDGLRAFERGESFGAEETVGIGDDAEEERFHLHAQASIAASSSEFI
jgi:hypothetical protein